MGKAAAAKMKPGDSTEHPCDEVQEQKSPKAGRVKAHDSHQGVRVFMGGYVAHIAVFSSQKPMRMSPAVLLL